MCKERLQQLAQQAGQHFLSDIFNDLVNTWINNVSTENFKGKENVIS